MFALLNPAQSTSLFGSAMHFVGCFGLVIMGLLVVLYPMVCFWRILRRAGFSGFMSLLCLLPGLGQLILLWILAFGDWPNQKNPKS